MGCAFSSSSPPKREQRAQGYEEPVVLATETSFTVNEVEAMYELYKKLSFSIFKDSLIHKVVSFMLGGVPACAVQDQQRGEHHQGYDLMVAVLFCSA
ncbi:calcineurin B-like protein 4 isoform X4 [Aegilops tauschii subsp. strangulata]|uniref:calcineurin B-like protein 4 isoform X4 n=1 Tax=Aegilops tauschii subsp. strangulata TaxID=200361 RepID=UPI00098AEE1A|nr:calcineurin B-like protein 4 isoform X8 [Aegilops tauschii subsp. strangulata]